MIRQTKSTGGMVYMRIHRPQRTALGLVLTASLSFTAVNLGTMAFASAKRSPSPLSRLARFHGAPPLHGLYAGNPLTSQQKANLVHIAQRTWKFFSVDLSPKTDLPMDNIGLKGAPARGAYTSPSDLAMYIWSIIAADNLDIISPAQASRLMHREFQAIGKLQKWHGFLLSWYNSTTGQAITGPGGPPISRIKGQFISTVDNGWYASSLIIAREAFPPLAKQASSLLGAMDFGIFYDAGRQATNLNAGQMYGGYYAGQGPAGFEYGNLNADSRIAAYVGIGTRELPGNVWWRTWRTLPRQFTWQTQTPSGPTVVYHDPYSGKAFSVAEKHYRYQGITYVPSWGGSAFEALMAPLVVPETSWGRTNFGLNDVNYAQASIDYARQALHFPVFGLSPASTPNASGDYQTYGAYPLGSGGSSNAYAHTAVTPYASFLALPLLPQEAYANIQALKDRYAIYGPYGFFDSVNPMTGAVGTRYLVLDQGMIMAGIDDALTQGGLQRYFAVDPVGRRIKPYLALEHFSISPAPGLTLHHLGKSIP